MTEAAATAIRAAISSYLAAYEAKDAKVCASFYTGDAWVVSPWGAPLHGRAAIQAAHLEWFEAEEHNKIMDIIDLRIASSMAQCLVRYAADVPGETGPEHEFGVSLNGFALEADGKWRITHSSLNELQDGQAIIEELT